MSFVARRLGVVFCAFAALICALAIGGCSSEPTVEEALESAHTNEANTAVTTLQSGVLTIGVNADSAPFAWIVDDTTGVMSGLDVDTGIAIADDMGLKVRFVNVGTNTDAAVQGLCDAVAGVNPDDITNGQSVLVGSYADSAPAVFAKNGQGTVTAEQLASSRVGVQTNSESSVSLSAVVPGIQTTGFDTINDAFAALEAGTVDYVVCDSFMGGYLAATFDDIDFVGALEYAQTRGFAVSAANATLQSALQTAFNDIQSNGIQASIRARYVGNLPQVTSSNQIAPAATTQTQDTSQESTATTNDTAEQQTQDATTQDQQVAA